MNITYVLFESIAISTFLLLPFIFKWELDKVIAIPAMILIGIACAFIKIIAVFFFNPSEVYLLLLQVLFIISSSVVLLLYRFYRDPVRIAPSSNNIIISPADGKIIYIKEVKKGEPFISEKKGRKFYLRDLYNFDDSFEDVVIVGISMSFLDVHVNRAPITGRVKVLKHIPGLFLSLKKQEAIINNERAFTLIENDDIKIGVLQITSRLVRNIKAYIRENMTVTKGEKIGMIRFGSQVDIVIPKSDKILLNVKIGQKVKAGITAIAKINIPKSIIGKGSYNEI